MSYLYLNRKQNALDKDCLNDGDVIAGFYYSNLVTRQLGDVLLGEIQYIGGGYGSFASYLAPFRKTYSSVKEIRIICEKPQTFLNLKEVSGQRYMTIN